MALTLADRQLIRRALLLLRAHHASQVFPYDAAAYRKHMAEQIATVDALLEHFPQEELATAPSPSRIGRARAAKPKGA